jgi:ribosome biogenesis protein Nip4
MEANKERKQIIQTICELLGSIEIPDILEKYHWLELESGIWLISEKQYTFIQKYVSEDLIKKLKYAGLFLGKMRKNFGLSIESLDAFKPYITRFVIVRGKTLQKYLYGKTVTIKTPVKNISNTELKKIIVMTPEHEPIGISSFAIFEEIVEENEKNFVLKLEPISDLGLYIRNESSTFE